MPLREYLCDNCCHQFDEFVTATDPDVYKTFECRCGSKARVLPSIIGGYQGSMGGSSTRPKNSTSMGKAKAFTGNPPEEQLEFDLDKKGE